MTKEQEEAISTMQHWIDWEKRNKDKIQKADELINMQETVLSMLQEQQEEINDLKEIKEIADMEVTELRKIKEVNKLKSDNWILQVKNERKDKIIDLMARAIDNYDSQLVINKFKDTEDIKQYFEDKVNSSEWN